MDKKKFMKIIKRIFFLPAIPTIIIAIPSFILVFYVLVKGNVMPDVAYLSYGISAYALIITVTAIVDFVKWGRQNTRNHPLVKKILSVPLVERYLSEKSFRAEAALYPSLIINLLYAGVMLFSGIIYRSVWFWTLAVYYILLAMMRFFLLHHVRRRGEKQESIISELKICRLCGIILMVLDWALVGIIILVVRKNSGFHAKGCLSANEAYDEMYNNMYEMIISDIMMPEIDGFEFAESVRRVNKHIPILFMSARDDLPSKQKGFMLGIDDYMVKPIELNELLLRVRALLRRANIEMERKLVVGNLELDADAMTARISGEEIPATTREFNILYKLLSYPNKTFSRAQLMDEFWGVDSETSLRAVDVYITKLRDKFSACDGFEIKTVRGLGYKAVL